jgi:ABC-2 type transport system permease protein
MSTPTANLQNSAKLKSICERLPSEERERQIFWKLRWRLGRSHLSFLTTKARLRTFLVVSLSLLFWCGLFALFYNGFGFIVQNVGLPGAYYHAQTVQFIFALFFASLQVMLVFSSSIIIYGGLYTSQETNFLLTLPLRDSRLVNYRFQEAVFFSSWGFFLLASPMMVAYGMVVSAPWYYFAYLPFLMLAFAYIPCALGAISCLLLINRLPQLRGIVVGTIALVVIAIAYLSIWRTLDITDAESLSSTWFIETFRRFEFTRGEWLPSTWLSNGLIDAARPYSYDPNDLPWLESGKYLIVLVSNALMLHVIVLLLGNRWFRNSFCNLHSRQARESKSKAAWIDRVANGLLFMLPKQTRLLITKDLRLFRRDPAQWAQFLIFLGLLLLYFANLDRFRQQQADLSVLTWINIVSFLNLAVVGLILSTFTTRFIYPLISLEGKRFWILGRLPVKRDTILWGKFIFAAGGSWLPCAGLVLLSDLVLNVSRVVVSVHQATCLMLCIGLSGMAVGLGALMPNFHEQSPSKIAAGFGGTLNLVLSALYILAIVTLTALPCHFILLNSSAEAGADMIPTNTLIIWLAAGLTASFALACLVTIIPLRSGLKAFRQLEV